MSVVQERLDLLSDVRRILLQCFGDKEKEFKAALLQKMIEDIIKYELGN